MSLHSRQFGSSTKVPEVTLGFWIIKILATLDGLDWPVLPIAPSRRNGG